MVAGMSDDEKFVFESSRCFYENCNIMVDHSFLGKKLDEMAGQAKIGEKQRKVLWKFCALSLLIAWFGIFWEFQL